MLQNKNNNIVGSRKYLIVNLHECLDNPARKRTIMMTSCEKTNVYTYVYTLVKYVNMHVYVNKISYMMTYL